ncbi:MAG TPA: hypothetical protein VGE93_20075 [Bryobacteraceae bacterium]
MGGDEEPYTGPWEILPWWHPARLLGYDLRRWVQDYNFHIGDDRWQYGRSKYVAREMLHSAYAPPDPPKKDAGREYDWFLESHYPPQH